MAIVGHTFIIIGFLLTMTFVGAIIGLPILAVGVALSFEPSAAEVICDLWDCAPASDPSN